MSAVDQVAVVAGAIPALIVVALVVLGIALLYALLETFVVGEVRVQAKPEEVPLLMVGGKVTPSRCLYRHDQPFVATPG